MIDFSPVRPTLYQRQKAVRAGTAGPPRRIDALRTPSTHVLAAFGGKTEREKGKSGNGLDRRAPRTRNLTRPEAENGLHSRGPHRGSSNAIPPGLCRSGCSGTQPAQSR
ncbi:MAG: hypothetical protein ABSH06_02190 [Thermodesulfobacteriota bacterium]